MSKLDPKLKRRFKTGLPSSSVKRESSPVKLSHEIRKHMAEVDGELPLSGEVEIDETYVGGKSHGQGCGRGTKNKSVVFGISTGDVNNYRDTNEENFEKLSQMYGVIGAKDNLKPWNENPQFLSLGGALMMVMNPNGVILTDKGDPVLWVSTDGGHLSVSADTHNQRRACNHIAISGNYRTARPPSTAFRH